jgi:biopolymer transport protein ExbD
VIEVKMKFESSHKLMSQFSLFSLANIVMLLLSFFLLSSQFVMQTGVNVKLSGTKSNEHLEPSNFTLTITDQNKIYVGADEVSLATLSAKLSEAKESKIKENLTIRADKSVRIDLIIKVLDSAKKIGLDKFIIQMGKN